MQMQMLCGSLTGVATTGLDNDLGYDDNGGSQGSAWARSAWDDEDEDW